MKKRPYTYSKYGENLYCHGKHILASSASEATIKIRRLPICSETLAKLIALEKEGQEISRHDFETAQFCFDEWNDELKSHPEILTSVYSQIDGSNPGYTENFYRNYVMICALGYLEPRERNVEALRDFYNQVKNYTDGGNAGHLRDIAFLSLYRQSTRVGFDFEKDKADYLANCKDESKGPMKANKRSRSVQEFILNGCDELAANPERAMSGPEADSPCSVNLVAPQFGSGFE